MVNAIWGPNHEWAPWMMGWSFFWLIPLMFIVFWILVIVALVYFIRWLASSGRRPIPAADSALDILKKRYARGEISKEEFEEKKKDLS